MDELNTVCEKSRHPELLIPASSLEVLKVAVIFGADAVYIGGEAFGLRAKAKNFTIEEMKEGVRFAHEHGVKVYVTANILAHNRDLEEAYLYFEELKNVKMDALIISDPALFTIAKEVLPSVDIHISTQANNTNYGTFNFWYRQGATRVVTARELSLDEIKEIREKIPKEMEIETFVHGAMCISYSGRCLLSSFMAGRDANQGACTHPCRWKYSVVEESRPGEYMPVYENERGTYLFNSKDLCMIEHIPDLIDAGVDSLKIEGRMKTALYVATVARTYRMALDDYKKDEKLYEASLPIYREEISKCTYRQYTTGFFYGKPNENTQIYDSNTYSKEYTYLGLVNGNIKKKDLFVNAGKDSETQDRIIVENTGESNHDTILYQIEQRNKFSVGEEVEIMKPDRRNILVKVLEIFDEDGNKLESAPHPKQKLFINLGTTLDDYDIIRRKDNR
ncbi:MAG: U32 family peptidase [Lachnospiraceae bacterium]|nr:U32 family peptidase [Lachnospiraceae bacterium]